jgi:hypothetical protein
MRSDWSRSPWIGGGVEAVLFQRLGDDIHFALAVAEDDAVA